jgi:ABC-2 type transport system ATP-binding protein
VEKSFGDVRALAGLDLAVAPGTVLGLLGPNGAGKTTAVRVLTTLLQPDAGTARVAGLDVVARRAALRAQIGLAGQYAAVDENLTGAENLVMVGRLYGRSRRPRASAPRSCSSASTSWTPPGAREDLLGRHAPAPGPRAALVARPPVLFLDEPTTGLDPRSRLDLWATIENLVAEGATVLLTTQYLDEADRWPTGSPSSTTDGHRRGHVDELKDRVGGERWRSAWPSRRRPAWRCRRSRR